MYEKLQIIYIRDMHILLYLNNVHIRVILIYLIYVHIRCYGGFALATKIAYSN